MPQFLSDGFMWGVEFERLWRNTVSAERGLEKARMIRGEQRSLEALDIPYFSRNTSDKDIALSTGQKVRNMFRSAGYGHMKKRFRSLSEEDLERQKRVINGSLYAKQQTVTKIHHYASARVRVSHGSFVREDGKNVIRDESVLRSCKHTARMIADRVCTEAYRAGSKGMFHWLGVKILPDETHYLLDFLDGNVYNGRCGIALFLAAAYKTMGALRYRDLARTILYQTVSALTEKRRGESHKTPLAHSMTIGGANGLGSIIYACTKGSEWLNDPKLLEQAKNIAQFITRDRIEHDVHFDVMAGSAGAILGLLSLYDKLSDKIVLTCAETCGRHLVKHRVKYHSFRAWQIEGQERPLTGFSHGAAGIAYALLRLYSITGRQTYFKAAREGILFERSVFSKKENNWPDFRKFKEEEAGVGKGRERKFQTSWCHGAPGITMARIGGLPWLDTPDIRDDIGAGLRITIGALRENMPNDTLCCGNAGLIEGLLMACERLSESNLISDVNYHIVSLEKRTRERLQEMRKRKYDSGGKYFFNPSLFQGMSGVGYELLRYAYAGALPSVLVWE